MQHKTLAAQVRLSRRGASRLLAVRRSSMCGASRGRHRVGSMHRLRSCRRSGSPWPAARASSIRFGRVMAKMGSTHTGTRPRTRSTCSKPTTRILGRRVYCEPAQFCSRKGSWHRQCWRWRRPCSSSRRIRSHGRRWARRTLIQTMISRPSSVCARQSLQTRTILMRCFHSASLSPTSSTKHVRFSICSIGSSLTRSSPHSRSPPQPLALRITRLCCSSR
mmetsp:Transcript_59670/g.132885  ORF Transcript_59670/g.132885 Transcript_59670/m.132885 type:complete len:220 (-) Transcript_59670:258-917(-)